MASSCSLCGSEAFRSAKLDSSAQRLVLFCTSCAEGYEVRGSQREAFTNKHGHPATKKRIESIHQIGFCDLVQFEEEGRSVFGVCIEIDRSLNMLAIVVWSKRNENEGRGAKRYVSLRELEQKNAFVFCYMPLDWLPLNEVLRKARESLEETTKGRSEEFANWLKTGRKKEISICCRDVTEACPSCLSTLDRSTYEGRTSDGRLKLLCADCRRSYEVQDTPDQWSFLDHVRQERPASKWLLPSAIVLVGIVGGVIVTPGLLSDFFLLTKALPLATTPVLHPPDVKNAAWHWMSSWTGCVLPNVYENMFPAFAFQRFDSVATM